MDYLMLSGFVVGLVGSLHCAGMCGPIVIALENMSARQNTLIDRLLYNFGRTITYTALGVVFGLIGQSLNLVGLQKVVSIVAGVLIILLVFIPSISHKFRFGNKFEEKIRGAFKTLFKKEGSIKHLYIGIVNGLLPCGMVYIALGGALALGSLWKGVVYMALFGLGTIPMLVFIGYSGSWLKMKWRKYLNSTIRIVAVVMAVLFILRGLSLGIPFLSPPDKKLKLNKEKTESSHNHGGMMHH